ncbi:hypothetical protein QBC47DRAFT_295083 [Echria macrotheca]|uniref:Uncharacterized protein n=1 Tax=Echria macrotheca TaxID=438768 RepID=A0AAJ0BHN7_9PEZI|nr:hypothetical protein QBC47DRAFT_295083 [Echria macrotheca]
MCESRTSVSHDCRKATGRHPWLQSASQWYLLFLYLIFTLLLTLAMTLWLDGKSFLVAGRSAPSNLAGRPVLDQSEVTTIVSVCLVIARVMCTAWQGLSAWRCVFILLEKTGLSLCEASCIAWWRLPAFSLLWSRTHWRCTGQSLVRSTAVLVLILAWPAQFASPLVSGSISWIPSNSYAPSNDTLLLGTASSADPWGWYGNYSDVREGLVKVSAGLAATTATGSTSNNANNDIPVVRPARRMARQLGSFPKGSAAHNATVPIFQIESFKWVSDFTKLPLGIYGAIKDQYSGFLNISRDDGPLAGGQAQNGTTALLKGETWEQPDLHSLPVPHHFIGTKYAAIYVLWDWNHGQGSHWNCSTGDSVFDPLPAGLQMINNAWATNYSDCIAVAELHIRAGVTQCRQAERPFLSSEPDCLASSGALLAHNETVSPDPLVTEVFAMMPEVQALIAGLQLHDVKSLKGGLETTLRNSLVQAYQGTWSALTESFTASPDQRLQTPVWTPHTLLKAQIAKWRVVVWMGLNLLLGLSGLLLFIIQSTCEGKTVNDPVVTAMMLDSSEVIDVDKTGLCNATDVGRGHGNAGMRMLLRVRSRSGSARGEDYFHPRLVPQDGYPRSPE